MANEHDDKYSKQRDSDALTQYRIGQLEKLSEKQEVRITSIERWQSAVESAAQQKAQETDPGLTRGSQKWVQIVILILTVLLAMITYLTKVH